MGVPYSETLAIRITAEGHASRRWRTARSASEASRLNERLSDARARTIRAEITRIINGLNPFFPIAPEAKGVGSRHPFPTASENNASVDRSVLVMVDLVRTRLIDKQVARPPRLVYGPSTSWSLTIASLLGGSAFGARGSFLRVKLQNNSTHRELSLAGDMVGGDLAIGPSTFGKGGNPFKFDPRLVPNAPVGNIVTFDTEPMDFQDWSRGGQRVRLVHTQLKTGITKSRTSFLQFVGVDTHPGSLVFDLKALGFSLGIPDVDIYVLTGTLQAENSPGDYVLTDTPPDVIPVLITSRFKDGIFLSFATGKFELKDLTNLQRQQLVEYVTSKARAIADLAKTFHVDPASP
jgi:hypothetical protein